MRSYVKGVQWLTDLCLAMKIDPLAVIRAVSAFVIVMNGLAVTLVFIGPNVWSETLSGYQFG